eukprot:SAG31_NODE_4304_length_3370_cov_1.370835_1_plen_90_part_10
MKAARKWMQLLASASVRAAASKCCALAIAAFPAIEVPTLHHQAILPRPRGPAICNYLRNLIIRRRRLLRFAPSLGSPACLCPLILRLRAA